MTSNLNKAFMRAYAKERHPTPGSETPLATERTLAGADAATPALTDSVRVQAPHYNTVQARPKQVAEPMATLQSARATIKPQAQPAPQASTQTQPHSDLSSSIANAAAVWQRIDEAQAYQPPHVSNPPSRPVMAAVGVGSAAGPQRMTAAVAPPVAPATRAAGVRVVPAEELPLIKDDVSSSQTAPNAETRRRTVADFLYSAGQYSASQQASTQMRSSQASVAHGAVGSAQVAPRPLSALQPSAEPTLSTGNGSASRSVHATSAKPSVASMSASAGVTSNAVGTMASMPLPQSPVAASAINGPALAPARQPAAEPRSPDSNYDRMGQILRVDLPRGTQQSAVSDSARAVSLGEARASVATMAPAMATQAASTKNIDPPAARYVIEQRRIDRAHELDATEEKLRRYKHKIFNPVWEVDCLQWPSVVDKLMQHRAESMSQVAAHLKTACQDGLSVLGVSSSEEAEGRTTVACCLARLAASHGLNVVLVDLDLDRPTLCVQTNMEIEHDWRDCLTEEVTLEEVAVHSIDDQLTVLPLKPRGNRPGLLASDSRIADMLNQLSESFELVVVDCSRMNSSGNVISGLAHAEIFDAAILVVDRRDSHQERVEDAVRVIQQTGIESIGIVDNFSM